MTTETYTQVLSCGLGRQLVGRVLVQHPKPWVPSPAHKPGRESTLVISTPGRWRREDQELQVVVTNRVRSQLGLFYTLSQNKHLITPKRFIISYHIICTTSFISYHIPALAFSCLYPEMCVFILLYVNFQAHCKNLTTKISRVYLRERMETTCFPNNSRVVSD